MLQTIVLIVHLFVTVSLVGVILLQRSEGGALGIGGGGSSGGFMSGRGAANFLTRTTAVLATIFFVASLALAFMAGGQSKSRGGSILDAPSQSAPAAPAPTGPQVPLSQ
jgi:preprotein translocase subunit SecG